MKNLDKILLQEEVLSNKQVEKAKKVAEEENIPLYEALEELDFISEKKLYEFLSSYLDLPLVDVTDYMIENKIIDLIPEEMAEEFRVLPLFKIGDTLTLAMTNPKDVEAIDKVKLKTGLEVIEPVLASPTEMEQAIDKYYRGKEKVEELIDSIEEVEESEKEEVEEKEMLERVDEAPIVKLVNLIITRAVENRASDIHIEPDEDSLRVRYRIDGILHEVNKPPKRLQGPVISRIKVLAGMDIAERRAPQDGRIKLNVKGKNIDLRVSTFPTINGENVVLRVLDKSSVIRGLEKLGFAEKDLKKFKQLIYKPNGIILVTGPTGSGKTTTLYSALSTINSIDKNIITLEDPVEYRLPLIRQTQINPKAGINFANGLRSILRQDPDVIMVGEIRDKETAEIAIRASLTGHLVFSTLHTNNAPETLTRLVDMGIEPYLISSSVSGILAQRLVRKVCPNCKKKVELSEEEKSNLNIEKEKIGFAYKGEGCEECRETGYAGRYGIFEMLVMDEEIKQKVRKNVSTDEIRKSVVEKGMSSLRMDGINKAKKGVTSIEEVLRVTQE